MMPIKPYSETDFERAKFSELFISTCFKQLDLAPRENPYDVDLKLFSQGKLVAVLDTEVKHGWVGSWPSSWETAHFVLRKGRYANYEVPHFQVVFNRNYTEAYVGLTSEIVKAETVAMQSTIFKEDAFYDVPLSWVAFGLDNLESFVLKKLNITCKSQ